MSKIDWSKPIETLNGTPARLLGRSLDGYLQVQINNGGTYFFYPATGKSTGGSLQLRNVKPDYSFWGTFDKFDEVMGRPFEPAVGAYLREHGARSLPERFAAANERADKNAAALDAAHREIETLKAQLAEQEERTSHQSRAIKRYRATLRAALVRADILARTLKGTW